ncbi:MAG: hypothetical protein U5K29_02345 [Acidimicrobiales bacterium]|nr:hypothetical protein [Acidimicrobiales bacterium]
MTDELSTRFTAELQRSWEAASTGTEVFDRAVSIAGLTFCATAAGDYLLDRIWPALGHHERSTNTANLTLRMWELRSSNAPRPSLPTALFTDDGRLKHHGDLGEVRVHFDPDSQMLVAFDRRAGLAWCCVEDMAQITWWERAAPLRRLFAWWLELHGRPMIHAAAVGSPDGAVLLAGPSGSGKSTTALTAARAGLGYLDDDHTVVSCHPSPRVHSLFSTAKLHLDSLDGDRSFASYLLDPVGEGAKAVVRMDRVPWVNLVTSAPVAAVAAITVSPTGTTELRPASPGQVLGALAPSTILQLHGTGAATLSALSRLVRQVPTATLEVGSNPDEVVAAVSRLTRGSVEW